MVITAAEFEALRTLDIVCFEGEGWATIRKVAAELGLGYVWTAQLLQSLRYRGLTETKPDPDHVLGTRLLYGLTEAGDRELRARDRVAA
jgi:DNA-binding MarR family transcriptional regulator